MAEYSLQDQWWNKPSRTESQLPALQLGVQIVQRRAQQDLQERDLANDIARTSLMREEMLAKQKIQTMLVAGNSEMASAISEVNDWTDEEQVSKVWAAGVRNPMTVGGKAWLGAQHMHESARTAKRLEEEARSRIAQRGDQSRLNALREYRRDLLADSTIDLNDARIAKYDKDIAFEERRLSLGENNATLRGQEHGLREKRFDANWAPEDRAEFNQRTKVINDSNATAEEKDLAIQEIREDITLKREQRLPKAKPPVAEAGQGASFDAELKLANEAIAANPARKAAIAEQFKKRTGRDLP